MKPEDVPIPETVKIQFKINTAQAMRQEFVADVAGKSVEIAQKDAEIQQLLADQKWALAKEEEEKVEVQRRQIAKQKTGLAVAQVR